jgi:hypothetical protein
MKRLIFSLATLACSSSPAAVPGTAASDAGADTPAGCYARADALVGVGLEPVAGENPVDPLGYPSFAVDDCAILYVRAGGDLVRQSLDRDGPLEVLMPASAKPRRPSAKDGLVAWEAQGPRGSEVRVWDRKTGARTTLAGTFHHAGEPRSAGDAVVFTGWLGDADDGDTDVLEWRRDGGAVSVVFGGPAQQRFPDGAAGLYTATDFSEDATGAFDVTAFRSSDILVYDTATGATQRRALPGKQAFATVDAKRNLVYLDWESVHPEPKFSAYKIRLGNLAGNPSDDALVAAMSNT